MEARGRLPRDEQKPIPNTILEELLAAKDAQIAALQKEVAIYRGQLSGAPSAPGPSAAGIKRSPSPPSGNGSGPPTGSRYNPMQICESDGEDGAPVGPSLASTRPRARPATRHGKIDLGMIELSDSDHEEVAITAAADPRRKRRMKVSPQTTSDAMPKKEPDVKVEAGVLQDSPPYKQRKLNHAEDGGDNKVNIAKKTGPSSGRVNFSCPRTDPKVEEPDSHARTVFKDGMEPYDKLDEVEWGSLLNPKAEIKKEYLLKEEDLLEIVSPAALKPFPITLADDKRSVTVTRVQLSCRFGGGGMDTFPRPNKNRIAVHGRSNFMCISLDWNPHGPQKPGHGGLFFETTVWPGDAWTANKKHSRTQTVFVKLRAKQWLYLGEYELIGHTPLTVQQWHNLHERVRSTWAHEISTSSWGTPIRARIHLRKTFGRQPAREEVETALGKFEDVSREDVRDALDAGEECICAWSMKCIGYDEDFQQELVELSRSA